MVSLSERPAGTMPYPPVPAREFLQRASDGATLDPLSSWLLHAIDKYLDSLGAWTWNTRAIAIGSALLLLGVRLVLKKRGGVDWYALIHAIITGGGSILCVYLDFQATPVLTGLHEPARSLQCYGPLTSLHRLLPAITMGYSIFDLIDGIFLGPDFLLHGFATLIVFSFYVEVRTCSAWLELWFCWTQSHNPLHWLFMASPCSPRLPF
jgi:hypothetical protein